ncbi:MAG: hypothetical protein ACOYMD_09135 [Paludibacter sp.]
MKNKNSLALNNIMTDSIEIVIVLYRCTLTESVAFQTLTKNLEKISIDYELIIYNNDAETSIQEVENYLIVNANANNMLFGAYNFALNRAIENNKKWLLLLDQDTIVTIKYLTEVKCFLENNSLNTKYIAAVPVLKKNDLHLSPIIFSPVFGPYLSYKPVDNNSDKRRCISAYNSASLLNVSFMKSIGGFSSKYPLDMQDHWYFYEFYKSKKHIYIMNCILEQDLSLLDMENSMSVNRYKIYLQSQRKFAKELSVFAQINQKIQLFKLIVIQLTSPLKRKFLKITFIEFVS